MKAKCTFKLSQYYNNNNDNQQYFVLKVLKGHWFFANGSKEENTRRKRTISLPSDCINIDNEDAEKDPNEESNNTLTRMVAKHFSATSDVRAFNINMPQSQ